MKLYEALKLYDEGEVKRIRRPWSDVNDSSIEIFKSVLIDPLFLVAKEPRMTVTMHSEDLMASDWEVVY